MPPEADEELCLPAIDRGLNFIRLATPTTDAKRLPAVLANTSGFLYYVSITGITGAAAPDVDRRSQPGGPDQEIHATCRLRSASVSAPRSRPGPLRQARMGSWWGLRWSMQSVTTWGQWRIDWKNSVRVLDLVKSLAQALRSP